MLTRATRKAATWLALLGVAFGALWPLVTHAAPKHAGVPMLICLDGVMATKTVMVDLGGKFGAQKEPRSHCALCLATLEPGAHVAPVPVVQRIRAPGRIAPEAPPAPPQRILLLERPPSQAPPIALAS